MRKGLMNPCGQIAQNFLAIGRATQRDRIAAVGRWRNFLDQPERYDVGLIAGVIYLASAVATCSRDTSLATGEIISDENRKR